MGPDFSSKMAVRLLTAQQVARIHQLFRQAKFADPSGEVRLRIPVIILRKVELLRKVKHSLGQDRMRNLANISVRSATLPNANIPGFAFLPRINRCTLCSRKR